ncbi:hypothetical protein PUNSTDRAFT_138647 [Punctularia strigosozonata HHB-11173 SS5]|uniref:BTB domain-containing protein n=1 Tax=Punctularia strigosozonata (strain HHB-11173) TaxID=741275 RepID=R7S3A4_PUNST|nr:uncharacterized protein PUNSTDRAFT_138647 [Punctularia strigosozonata HHB-11173 SS5]EIN04252.1 hypothetical protein PUNSTDRAFT_138647 [Punctularia strigosozonata HHB-11173 SS5]
MANTPNTSTGVEDIETSTSLTELTRCEGLWYEDGSIVLASEGVGFRVYRMLLAQNSSVFANMLAMSSPESNIDPSYDCPIVHMPDSAAQLRYLLLALHDVRATERLKRAPFMETIAVASLAAKYEIGHLLDSAVERFASMYPTSFNKWVTTRGTPVTPVLKPGQHHAALQLAHQLQMSHLVPVILLAMCYGGVRSILRSGLPPHDLEVLLLGFTKLQVMQRTHTFRWLYRPVVRCTAPASCNRRRAEMSLLMEKMFSCDKLYVFDLSLEQFSVPLSEVLCDRCVTDAFRTQKAGLESAWEDLPSVFGMETWHKLGAK